MLAVRKERNCCSLAMMRRKHFAPFLNGSHMKIISFIHHISTLHIPSLLHSLWLRLTDREYIITGSCTLCGRCCQNIHLKYHRGWIKSEAQFHELLQYRPEYHRFTISSEQQAGGYIQFTCSWYDRRYGCTDYNNRLDICRKYPGKSLKMQGAHLLPGCGYRIDEGTPFHRHLAKEMKRNSKK